MGFVDVYNMFNTNGAQTLTTSSGGFWLRPTAITGPRVLRIGARVAMVAPTAGYRAGVITMLR